MPQQFCVRYATFEKFTELRNVRIQDLPIICCFSSLALTAETGLFGVANGVLWLTCLKCTWSP